jgi:hypothetical protein
MTISIKFSKINYFKEINSVIYNFAVNETKLIFKDEESKNKELIILQNYIIENKNKLNNTIFVLDSILFL